MSDEELGLVAAQVARTSAAMNEEGIDLHDPHATLLKRPRILWDLTTAVIELQKQGRQVQAPGLLVWVHTLRAEARLELRYLAKEMWQQLERGFPSAEDAAVQYASIFGGEWRTIDRFLRIPKHFDAK
jgi:hypothetical protein